MKTIKKIQPIGHGALSIPEGSFSYDDFCPAFSFEYIQKGFDIKDCQIDDKNKLLSKMRTISHIKWKEILGSIGRHQNGKEDIPSLKDELPSRFFDAMPIAFRFSGKKPMIGVRDRDIFYIIWIDPQLKKYKH